MKKVLLFTLPLALLVFMGSSCDYTPGTQATQSDKQEEIQKNLVNAVPVPTVSNSTTREALSDRTKLFDDQNKVSYIYLISYGKVMAFYSVKGQVVSLRSYLTPMENIVNSYGVSCSKVTGGCGTGYIVQTPDVDGTYGDNVDGVFFFTTDGAYVEWKGDYMVSDQPLKLSTPAELIREVK